MRSRDFNLLARVWRAIQRIIVVHGHTHVRLAGIFACLVAPLTLAAAGADTGTTNVPSTPTLIGDQPSPVMDELASASQSALTSQSLSGQLGTPLFLGFSALPGVSAANDPAQPGAGLSVLFYQPASTDSVGTPLPDAVLPETEGILDNLALTAPNAKDGGSGLLLSGMFYMSNGSHAFAPGLTQAVPKTEQALSQNIGYKDKAFSFSLNYRDVGKDFGGTDALHAMQTQDSAINAATMNDLLSHKGQDDLNLNMGFTGSSGMKAGFILDNLTDANTNQRSQSETFNFEQDLKSGLGFSATHAIVSTDSLLGGAGSENTTDHVHMGFAPAKATFNITADETIQHTDTGSSNDQMALALTDKLKGFNFTGNLTTVDTGGAGTPDHTATEQLHLDGAFSKTESIATTWNGASDVHNWCADRSDFDTVLKSTFGSTLAATEFSTKDDGDNRIQDFHEQLNLAKFAGMTKAAWTANLSNQSAPNGQSTRSWDVALDSTMPAGKKVKLPAGLPGAGLHFEYAGNVIGAAPGVAASDQSARALRIVSGPIPGNWLSWSIYDQQRSAVQSPVPSVRDYSVTLSFLKGETLCYTNLDQQPQPNGIVKDIKTQDVKFTAQIHPKQPLQLTAEYVGGADRTDNLAQTQSVLVGVTGPVTPKMTMDLSLGRTRQVGFDGGFANGTTCKVAYKWDQDSSNLLDLTSSITYWDSGGSRLVSCPIDASAQLSFKRIY